jgi:toxin ParE1/3/4
LNPIYHPEAEFEVTNATEFYRARVPQQAAKFWAAFEDCTLRVLEMPEAFPIVFQGVPVRRAKLNSFPYQLIYVIDPDAIYVVALMHERQEPLYWLRRLEF